MKLISFKADRLLLCVFFSQLWVFTDCTTTSQINTVTKPMMKDVGPSVRASSTNSQTTTPLVTTPKPKPQNPDGFKATGQNETSITLQWNKVEGISNYKLTYEKGSKEVTSTDATTIHDLTSGSRYNITLFSMRGEEMSEGTSITAVTAPRNVENFKFLDQNETSITLTWDSVENISIYTLWINGKEEENITESSRGTIKHVVPNLTSGTRFEFSLFTVFDYARSSGNNITAVTAPSNADNFGHIDQNETSITLQWKGVKDISNYTLLINGREETDITQSTEFIIHVVGNLNSGTRNEFILFTVFEYARSSGINIKAVTAPANAENFAHIDQNETSITLTWDPVANISNYTLLINGKEEENITGSSRGTIKHVVPNLTSGTRNEFRLFTVFDYARSSGKDITAVTAPANAENFMNLTQNETSITLQWKRVKDISDYTLRINGNEETNITKSTELITYVVTNLNSGTENKFSLFTLFEYARSSGNDITAVTVPSRVVSVKVIERTENSIRLEWQSANINWVYKVLLNGSDVPAGSTSADLPKLLPGTKYVVSVISQFSGFSSAAFDVVTVTKINCAAANWQVTNSTITGRVEGLFSSATAVPKEQTEGSANTNLTGSNIFFTQLYPGATYNVSLFYEIASEHLLQCSHSLTLIPPTLNPQCKHRGGYSVKVSWETVKGVWTSVKININGKSNDVPKDKTELQIDQLQPAKTYKGSLVSVSGTEKSAEVEFYCSTDPAGVIGGSVFGVLCLLLLVGLAAFIYIKKPDILSRKKPFIDGSKQHSAKGKKISAANFPDHFHQLSLDENRGLSQEYEDLSAVGTDQARRAALLPDNKVKNRFTNVLPYDWCRVKLSTSGPSETLDYINASYMPGYTTNREYIATQGPLPGTVKDFWRMIWEQQVKRIAMVTNCVEGGRTKCERYWPENGNPGIYGEISVTVTSEKRDTSWTLRDFTVKHMKTSEERTVKHFHFTAWPDHGVPENTDVLIQFRGLMRQHIDSESSNAPTVVHCSAGVGRTGTLIALDVLLQQLGKEQAVDIKYFVRKMRLNRPYMVQTESQYVFLHQCIMDSLTPNTNLDDNFYENVGAVYVNATALRELSLAQGKHPN
uniref:protein-tyrosine-phosphatase n=1 Tax=Oryzias latipes TaxID=8090 RepID=A0A3P9JAD9_ORYLA